MSGLVGKTAPGTGREGNSGFPKDSMTDAVSALTMSLVPSRTGAALLASPHPTKARNGFAVGKA
jgi:hypothetical protein